MRGWTVAMVTVGMLVGMEAGAFQPYVQEESSPEVAELRARLAEQEAHMARLEEEAALYAEAEVLGVVEAVQASRLPERQQRRLAMAIVREARRNEVGMHGS